MLSLIDRIEDVAENMNKPVTFIAGDDENTISWAELHTDAKIVAAGLQARGVKPGDHVALLGPTTQKFVTAVQAAWICGAVLVTMPLPMRMGALDLFISQTRARIRGADSKVVVIDSELAAFVEPIDCDPPFIPLDELFGEGAASIDDYKRPKSDPNLPRSSSLTPRR